MLRRSTWFYKARRRDDTVIRKRIREIAETRVRYGCQRIFTLLRRQGWRDNHKRVHRLYRLEGLNLRSKQSQRYRMALRRLDRPQLSSICQCWSMDFVTDQLFDGRRIRRFVRLGTFYLHSYGYIFISEPLNFHTNLLLLCLQ
ncbi:IS3 family transposase [Spirosoma sp. HMF4905]|uniref:IS3 family transposase n=1 Tax=Spirosoma arboris TaxID=2682092 RepID=A0A7K1SK72_9BACT|nr:IS3 family transposase [Spirosoma arboris]